MMCVYICESTMSYIHTHTVTSYAAVTQLDVALYLIVCLRIGGTNRTLYELAHCTSGDNPRFVREV